MSQLADSYEKVALPKTNRVCPLCEDYAERQSSKPVAVMSCEGACLRGEIARQAANIVCHELAPEKTVRVCLGGAFTKATGQRRLVGNSPRVIAMEGCFIECASRMMKGVIPELDPEVIVTDRLCDFDKDLFGIDEMPEEQIKSCARQVAAQVVVHLDA